MSIKMKVLFIILFNILKKLETMNFDSLTTAQFTIIKLEIINNVYEELIISSKLFGGILNFIKVIILL